MLEIDVLSLFPGLFEGFLTSSIVARAIARRALRVEFTDFREFSGNKHNQVDDYCFGGFPGMVLQPAPVYEAINRLVESSWAPVVYLTPQGRKLEQPILEYYSSLPRFILLCGHYKELDQRLRDLAVCDEISLGDYVLSGGEIPAMAFIDGVAEALARCFERHPVRLVRFLWHWPERAWLSLLHAPGKLVGVTGPSRPARREPPQDIAVGG